MNLDTYIFVFSAVVAVFSAAMMISQRNPVASVLYMIVSLVAQALLYVQLGALFLGALLIIVYAGAIMVLFLFVIMLLNLRGTEDLGENSHPVSRIVKYGAALLLLVELIFVVRGVYLAGIAPGIMATPTDNFGSVKAVAMLLFTKYLYPFELTGVLLLVAVVGAVVISRKERPDEQPNPEEYLAESKLRQEPVDKAVH